MFYFGFFLLFYFIGVRLYGTNRIAAKSLDLGALQARSSLLGLMLVKWVIAWFIELTK